MLIIAHLIGFKSLWFPTVAVHTDSWLLAVAFFHGAKLSRQDKKRLFEKCNELPSLYETITGKEKIVWAPKKLGSSNKRPVGKMGAVASQKVIIPIVHIIRLFYVIISTLGNAFMISLIIPVSESLLIHFVVARYIKFSIILE